MKKSLVALGMIGMLVLAGCNIGNGDATEGGETTTTPPASSETTAQ